MIDHKADVAIEVRAKSLKEVFVESMKGLIHLVIRKKGVPENTKEEEILLEGTDAEDLLVRWLNELIYYVFVKKLIPLKVKEMEIEPSTLRALLLLSPFNPAFFECVMELKAATYHGLKIRKVKGGFKTEIVFDI